MPLFDDNPVKVLLAGHPFSCDVARSSRAHTAGLQSYDGLREGEGLLFEFPSVSIRTFHQASVSFPIDIIFIKHGHISHIVEDSTPGSRQVYSAICDQVLEVMSGTCKGLGIGKGDPVEVSHSRHADSLNEWAPSVQDMRQDELDPQDTPERGHELDEATLNRGIMLSEPSYNSWEDANSQILSEPALDVRPELQTRNAQVADGAKFVRTITPILKTHADALEWQPDTLNSGATEHATINRSELSRMLSGGSQVSGDGNIGAATPEATQAILRAAGTMEGLRLIGDAYIQAGLADFSRPGFKTKGNTIVLYRAKNKD